MSSPQEALDTLTYGVTVVTSKAGHKTSGLALSWLAQVSMDPPLVATAVHKKWHSHEVISEAEHFIVNVLAEDQTALGKHFGSSHGWDTDKFAGLDCATGIDDIPALKGCRAVLECHKINAVDAGDHTIFIGQLVRAEVDETKKEQVLDRKVYFG